MAEDEHPVTVRVPIGTTIEEVVALAGGTTVKDPVYFIGGPMMGFIGSGSQPVTKTTNAVLVLPQDHYLVKRKRSKSSIDMNVRLHAAVSVQCVQIYVQDICLDTRFSHTCLCVRQHAKTFSSRISLSIHSSAVHVVSVSYIPVRQELSPRTLMLEYKNGLRANGLRAPEVTAVPVGEERSYRRVPMERLMSRLDLNKI